MSVFRINKSPDEENRDKGMRDKLNAHSVTPPSYIWDNVEENLPQKPKRRPFILWLMPLAACLAGLACLLYILWPENASVQNKNEIFAEAPSMQKSEHARETNSKTEALAVEKESATAQNSLHNGEDLIVQHKSSSSNAASKTYQGVKITSNQKAGIKAGKAPGILNIESRDDDNKKTYAGKKRGNDSTLNNSGTLLAGNTTTDAENGKLEDTAQEIKTIENPVKAEKKVTPSNNKNQSKWAFGAELGAGSSYRIINYGVNFISKDAFEDAGPDQVIQYNSTDYQAIERAGSSWSGALNTRYNFNDKWSLSSGLGYTKTSIQSKYNVMVMVKRQEPIVNASLDTTYQQTNSTGAFTYEDFRSEKLNVNTGSVTSTKNEEYQVKYNFSFTDVPLHLQYRASTAKATWFVQAGPTLRFLSGKKAVYRNNGYEHVMLLENNYNKLAVSASIASGISLPVKNFDIQFGPSFSMWLTPLIKDANPKTHLYNTQLKAAIYYKL